MRVNQWLHEMGTPCAYWSPRPLESHPPGASGRSGRLRFCRYIRRNGFMRLRSFAALLAITLFAWPVAAQEQRGSIEGVIKDASGAVLPGTTVTLESGSGAKLEATTDAQGLYRFPSLLPGRYTVNANLAGFRPGKQADVEVNLGTVKKVDFSLGVGAVSETVQVTGESPLVDVKQSTRATNIRAEQVNLLPHNPAFSSMLPQPPATNHDSKSSGVSIADAPPAQ